MIFGIFLHGLSYDFRRLCFSHFITKILGKSIIVKLPFESDFLVALCCQSLKICNEWRYVREQIQFSNKRFRLNYNTIKVNKILTCLRTLIYRMDDELCNGRYVIDYSCCFSLQKSNMYIIKKKEIERKQAEDLSRDWFGCEDFLN